MDNSEHSDEDDKAKFSSILGMHFSFELSMLVFGAYSYTCYRLFESTLALIASMLVGGLVFYLLQRNIKQNDK